MADYYSYEENIYIGFDDIFDFIFDNFNLSEKRVEEKAKIKTVILVRTGAFTGET